MDFFMTSDTAGARVGELAHELYRLVPGIEEKHIDIQAKIEIVIRCLPDSYNRRSFTRYLSNENDLTIDFCVSLEEYRKLYRIKQRFELGKTFLEWLDRGLSNKNFIKNNPGFSKDDFINDVISRGKEAGWFADEVDYSQELEF
jgi:hypothetical protein